VHLANNARAAKPARTERVSELARLLVARLTFSDLLERLQRR